MKLKIIAILLIGIAVLAEGIYIKSNISQAETTSTSGESKNSVSNNLNNSTSKPLPNACVSSNLPKEIIVSISDQYLWACENSELVYETAVVTGAYEISKENETPTGSWQIYSKESDRYLTGVDYREHVDYWMPFYGDYGLHDASWRDSFGAMNYPTQGSHGCVNLPQEVAGRIYNWSDVGTTVTIRA